MLAYTFTLKFSEYYPIVNAVPVPDFAAGEPAATIDAPKSSGRSALYNVSRHHDLHAHIRQIYYDFKHLGYFDLYGASCFAISTLVARILRSKGYDTEVRGCHAIFSKAGEDFYLGYKGYARPGQVEGHVVCIANGNIVLDFGLGSVKKHYKNNFYRAIACVASNYGPVLATLELDSGIHVQWRTDWVGAEVDSELVNQEPYLQPILEKYESYRKNRIGYLIKNMFKGTQSRSTFI